jgi:hypothetical protein
MKKQKIIILSGVILLGLVASVYQYITVMRAEMVGAADTKPSNGHSWSEMESDSDSIQVLGRTITNLAAPVASTDATNKAYVDAASGDPACPTNYANLCSNGGGLAFTYSGHTMYIDAFPRAAAWYTSGSPTGQSLAWQMCGAIGARLPTQAEWQAACTALSGPNGNGMTTFGGGKSDRYEWTATPSSSTLHGAVMSGGGSCSGTTEGGVTYSSYGWFRCVR